MELDSTLTLITIAVAIVGVIATLVAPSFGRTARVSVEITDVVRLPSGAAGPNLSILVRHGGELIDQPVFVLLCVAENTGTTDLVGSHFVEPIEIVMPPYAKILSAEVQAKNGVRPVVAHTTSRTTLQWTILKPRERIELSIIAAAQSGSSDIKQIVRDTATVARLIDVKTGRSLASNPLLRWIGGGVLAVLTAFAILTALIVTQPRQNLFLLDGARAVRVEPFFGDAARICSVSTTPQLWNDCEDITLEAVPGLLREARVGEGYIGLNAARLWLLVPILVLLGTMLSIAVRSSIQSFTRAFERRRRAQQSDSAPSSAS